MRTRKVNVGTFFESEKNKKMIISNQEYSAEVTAFIKENIVVKGDILTEPFTI